MHKPELHVKLPSGLPTESYEGIRQAVASLLELWGVQDAGTRLISTEVESTAITTNGTTE
ncbi:hypothetical protein ABZ816_28315 [Actinosynnema sp. NPDC047251]|uniref:Uncharacterized protein n=1 Tax=Saccharothrix espanaensis (strain ATCC 51144 / DSM 44229 / JCM 9112 / NBRC 15066 / NRRL 15764) TaxID=1179773 RepID=K0JVS7_SACES|nr:hypothetical protein [Saccharothrix espanaensis]CCH28909.1 hypothetical protein BN6_15860 [Saccharothrix espanaensis DSM 44229]